MMMSIWFSEVALIAERIDEIKERADRKEGVFDTIGLKNHYFIGIIKKVGRQVGSFCF